MPTYHCAPQIGPSSSIPGPSHIGRGAAGPHAAAPPRRSSLSPRSHTLRAHSAHPLPSHTARAAQPADNYQTGSYHFTPLHEHTEVLIKKHFSHSLIAADITQYHVTGRRPMSAPLGPRRGPSLGAATQPGRRRAAVSPSTGHAGQVQSTALSSFYPPNKCHMIIRRR